MMVSGLTVAIGPESRRRLLAGSAAALVLALSVLAASPSLHAWLHPDADQGDHVCAVTLYLQGMTAPAAEVALLVILLRLVARLIGLPAEPDLLAPRYRLSPGRAPPVG